MKNQKILVIGSYPIIDPQHGGQKRTAAIVKNYQTFSTQVEYVGVYDRNSYTTQGSNDILVAQEAVVKELEKHPYFIDYLCGLAITNDIHVRSPLAKLLMDFKPDVIHIEQPYAYAGLQALIQELDVQVILVYGSQNIEYRMKKDIYRSLSIPKATQEMYVKKIRAVEEELTKKADLVVAVSEDDALELRNMGANKVVVAPNGISAHRTTEQDKKEWSKEKVTHGYKDTVLFVGSGHPPNWNGFREMVGSSLDFLPQNAKIVVAGGVSDQFQAFYANKPLEQKRLVMCGRVTEGRLNALIDDAAIIILPITSGGGSNLKTAEAILSHHKTVATSYSLRGYEQYASLPTIFVADDRSSFTDAIRIALESKHVTLTGLQSSLTQKVLWEYSLASIKKALQALLIRRMARRTRRAIKKQAGRVVRKLTSSR